VLVLIALILFGVALIALASVVLLGPRRAAEARKAPDLYPAGSEREVYEKLYGKRSTTVSAPVPVERRPEADVDSAPAGLRD
jgi:hypothetical protein